MQKLVVGNWKMNGSVALVRSFAELTRSDWPDCEAAVCVPYPLLSAAQSAFGATPLRWGAQDCSAEDEGAFTGEVSVRMIREFGARYVVVGHSERRAGHADTDGHVASKAQKALAEGLTPIVCIGEKAEERDGNQTAMVLRRQLLQLVRTVGRDLPSIVIAYEPVWAIGTGQSATPGMIEDTHGQIAEILAFHAGLASPAVRILYGGSVNPRNAGAILSRERVDGVLVGNASLAPGHFIEICRAAACCSGAQAADAAGLSSGCTVS
jgi:triosephosphate isomerase (TIM)